MVEPASAPRGSMEVFLHRRDQGISHMGQEPGLTGFLGWPAVWILAVCMWVAGYGAFSADV